MKVSLELKDKISFFLSCLIITCKYLMCVGYLDYECISPDKYIYPQIGLSLHEGHIFAVMINEAEMFSSVTFCSHQYFFCFFVFVFHDTGQICYNKPCNILECVMRLCAFLWGLSSDKRSRIFTVDTVCES